MVGGKATPSRRAVVLAPSLGHGGTCAAAHPALPAPAPRQMAELGVRLSRNCRGLIRTRSGDAGRLGGHRPAGNCMRAGWRESSGISLMELRSRGADASPDRASICSAEFSGCVFSSAAQGCQRMRVPTVGPGWDPFTGRPRSLSAEHEVR